MGENTKQMQVKKLGEEYPESDEHQYVDAMVRDLERQLDKLYPKGQTLRQTHPKMHGCVRAEFTISPDLAPELRIGIFKEPGTYDAYIRFSNANTFLKHDIKKDVRGMAIKILNVPGEKLHKEAADALTQDFVLITNDIFFSKNAREFHKLIHAFTSGPISMIRFLVPMRMRTLSRLMKSNKACDHILDTCFWSTTPYLFGQGQAVKYHVRPANEKPVNGSASKTDENYLRTNMSRTLNEQDVFFDFCIQRQQDPYTMPVEDPTVRWTSPFEKVATIRIPIQQFDTDEQNHMGDGLSFSPWHSLPEHRPLGSVNRARREIYYAMSKYWHKNNDQYADNS